MTTHHRYVPLNRGLIAERMHALAVSERQLTSRTGMSHVTFRMARLDGEIPASTPITQLVKLSEELGFTLIDLLTINAEPAPPPKDVGVDAASDATTLIPLLVHVPRLTGLPYLARVLEWEPARLHAALDACETALVGTGLKLHKPRDSVRLIPITPPPKETRQRLARSQTKSGGMNRDHASTLKKIYDGTHSGNRNIGNSQRLVIGALANMGCIEIGDKGVWHPTAAFRAAFPQPPTD